MSRVVLNSYFYLIPFFVAGIVEINLWPGTCSGWVYTLLSLGGSHVPINFGDVALAGGVAVDGVIIGSLGCLRC